MACGFHVWELSVCKFIDSIQYLLFIAATNQIVSIDKLPTTIRTTQKTGHIPSCLRSLFILLNGYRGFGNKWSVILRVSSKHKVFHVQKTLSATEFHYSLASHLEEVGAVAVFPWSNWCSLCVVNDTLMSVWLYVYVCMYVYKMGNRKHMCVNRKSQCELCVRAVGTALSEDPALSETHECSNLLFLLFYCAVLCFVFVVLALMTLLLLFTALSLRIPCFGPFLCGFLYTAMKTHVTLCIQLATLTHVQMLSFLPK